MERWNNYTFISLCVVTNCMDNPDYPIAYGDQNHRSMPSHPVDVQIDFHVTGARMNFDNRILYIAGAIKMSWWDTRKAGLSTRAIGLEKKKLKESWEQILQSIWLPGMVYAVNMMNIIKQKGKDESLLIQTDGQVIYMNNVLFGLHCGQLTNRFPFEKYACGLNMRPQVRNSSVTYSNFQNGWPQEVRTAGFRLDHFYTEAIKRKVMTYQTTYFYHQFSVGVIVTRRMWILVATFLVPTIAVSILDTAFYVYSKSFLLRFSLIPAYFSYMRLADKNKTDYDWPLIAIFLYSRFICSVILACWNIASATSFSRHAKDGCFHPNWQNNWMKRLLAVVLITASIQVTLLIRYSGFFTVKRDTRTYEEIIRDGD